jgi:hypothetical protein
MLLHLLYPPILAHYLGIRDISHPYEMKFTDAYGNIVARYVDRPEVISNFFRSSNAIDTHNQLRQDLLQLEKNG